MQLEGKTALVTGGGTGIGRAISLMLAREGVNIVVNYSRSEAEAADTVREIERAGSRGMLCRADVSNLGDVRAMVASALDRFGRIDVLVNNAGYTRYVDLHDLDGMEESYWDRTFNVNVKGMFFVSRACAAELVRNRGCILNITSIAGFNGTGSSIAYAASKAAGISLTKSFSRVLAPHVRVNSVAPGIVDTRWVDGREEHIQKHSDGTPLGRIATPEDVAQMSLALIRYGDFVTGQTIVVDGGWSL
jgi:3-oxoacyl-[acyl-carrier protein] reductase